jgi:probable F420-dependent oxidoreductase
MRRFAVHIGAVLPHHELGSDAGAIKAYLQGLEGLGVTHLLMYEHVLGGDRATYPDLHYFSDTQFHEPMTFLAYAAGVTERLGLLVGVLVLPQRQTVLVAKQAAEIAIVSENRLRLGVGTGWNTIEYEALGVPFQDRGARQEEQVELMRRLWTEEVVTFRGRFDTVSAAGINPRPTQAVPVWLGGTAPVALARCGRIGDGYIAMGEPDDTNRECLEIIRSARAERGLSMEGFGVQAQTQFVGGNPEGWRMQATGWRDLGATHLAIATHNAGPTNVDGHLDRLRQVLEAVSYVSELA